MGNGNPQEAILHLSGDDAIHKVRELLKHFRSTMMITRGGFDTLHSRPMGLQGDTSKFGGVLWFFTDRTSPKAMEISADPVCSLLFQNDADNAYLHLYGRAFLVEDHAKMRELYSPIIKTWFPKGLEDPRLTLIRFEAERGDFWDSPAGMLNVLAAFTKSVVTGIPGQGGERGDVTIGTRSETLRHV